MEHIDNFGRGVPNRQVGFSRRRINLLSALMVSALALTAGPGRAEECADVELVLAIDSSASIDWAEFTLQQKGYAEAFRRADVHDALQAAGIVDVAVLLWGDTEMGLQVLPWVRLDGEASYLRLAAEIEKLPRRVHGGTGLGRAIWHSLNLFTSPGNCSPRRIINVSGDGNESVSPPALGHVPLAKARERAEAMNVEINALAIENEVPGLSEWFRVELAVGPGAFVMRVDGFDTFAEAIAKKLIREVAPPNVAFSPIGPLPAKT